MKDVPHHMADFIKSYSKEENPKDDKIMKEFEKEHPPSQQKKQLKAKKRKAKAKKVDITPSIEQENNKMKKRTPQIRERSHKTTF